MVQDRAIVTMADY